MAYFIHVQRIADGRKCRALLATIRAMLNEPNAMPGADLSDACVDGLSSCFLAGNGSPRRPAQVLAAVRALHDEPNALSLRNFTNA